MNKKTPAEICEAVALDFKARKITHQKAGDAIGKSKAVVSNLISGKKPFSKAMADLFSRAFDYNTRFLLYGEGELRAHALKVDAFAHMPFADANGDIDYIAISNALTVCENLLTLTDNDLAIDAWNHLMMGDYDKFMENYTKLYNRSEHNARPKFLLGQYLALSLTTSWTPMGKNSDVKAENSVDQDEE